MYAFGYNGHLQLSELIRQSLPNVAGNICKEPREISVKYLFPQQNTPPLALSQNQIQQINISHISLSWDSILFILDDGRWNISGYLAPLVRKVQAESLDLLTSGSLAWNNLTAVSRCGSCVRISSDPEAPRVRHVTLKPEDKAGLDNAVCVTHVRSGGKHGFALTDSQRLACIQEKGSHLILRPINLHVAIKQVSCGHEHTLLLSRIGSVFSFGIGGQGQLGHGDVEHRNGPEVVEAIEGVAMVMVAAGGWHSATVSDIGDLYVWGWNERGQLGFLSKVVQEEEMKSKPNTQNQQLDSNNSGNDIKHKVAKEYVNILATPTLLDITESGPEVMGSEITVSKVSCGSRHTAAITDCGRLYIWGWNKYGQLGLGDTVSRDQPTQLTYFTERKLTVCHVTCGAWNTILQTETKTETKNPESETDEVLGKHCTQE